VAYKRVTYSIEMPVNPSTIDYLFDGLNILLSQGRWSKDYASAVIPNTTLHTGVVQDSTTDSNGLAGLIGAVDVANSDTNLDGLVHSIAASIKLVGSGGMGPYTYSLFSGTVPPGMTLAASGILSGTPDTPGPFTFVVRITDAFGAVHNQSYTATVA